MRISVKVSSMLIEDALKTGFMLRPTVVSKGLPKDAKLINVVQQQDNVRFVFESEVTQGDDCEVNIEITTMSDVI